MMPGQAEPCDGDLAEKMLGHNCVLREVAFHIPFSRRDFKQVKSTSCLLCNGLELLIGEKTAHVSILNGEHLSKEKDRVSKDQHCFTVFP